MSPLSEKDTVPEPCVLSWHRPGETQTQMPRAREARVTRGHTHLVTNASSRGARALGK